MNRRSSKLVPLLAAGLLSIALIASPAVAAPPTAVGSVTPSSVPAGATTGYSFSLAPSSGTIGSFNLTAPAGWVILSLDSAPAGVTLTSSTQIQGRGLSVSASSPLAVGFTAQAPCGAASTNWTLAARSGPNFTGSTNGIDPSSSLSTALSGTCAAEFVVGRGPADAAFNGNPKSENITSVPFTPAGTAMQVLVTDATGAARSGIAITLTLQCTAPVVCGGSGASLSGPVTATSNASGLATFTGSAANPISVSQIGFGYHLTPTGTGVTGTQSAPFAIFEEGEQCSSSDCVVRGNSSNRHLSATIAANTPSGSLAVLVSGALSLDCGPSIPAGYNYKPVSGDIIAWLYTGTGSQTIVVELSKQLIREVVDRGSAHLDVCYLVDVAGKSFVDKFGQLHLTGDPGLLPDCGPGISENCIVSQTAAPGGGRVVTFTVEDGRGKI
ncbi:MAG TPA: hypothetical protein VLA90_03295 [Actinomycetota bacterium]|nr:hypothetical protein [Actinomycetota bacterium]